jgi:2-hydroxy-3-oxopropionate reductase
MAMNLVDAEFPVVVHNRTRAAQETLVQHGAVGAETLQELTRSATVIITMLSDDDAVRAVLDGPDGIVELAAEGTLIIDMSTVSPALSRSLAQRASARGVATLDAPVSGGDVGARDGTLSIMVGGSADDVERARPIFEVLGSRIVHAGGSGTGQAVKACNQVLVAITYVGVSEALVLGSKLGVAPDVVLDALGGGLAANRIMEVKRTNLLEHNFTPGFRVDLHHKDLAIALASAALVDASLPFTALAQQMFQQLRASGRGGDDHSALLTVVESWADHETGT